MHKFFLALVTMTGLMSSVGIASNKAVHQDLLHRYSPVQVSGRVWMIEGPRAYPSVENGGFMNNPGFIIGDESVVVVDPGSSTAIGRAVVAHIKKLTDKPISHVFTTHVHGDHWLANEAIAEAWPNAQFFAHPQMIRLAIAGEADRWIENLDSLTNGATSGTIARIPDIGVEHEQVFVAGNISVKAHLPMETSHTKTDVMYEVLGDKVLFTGDNINYKRIVRMDDGSFPGNAEAAAYALSLDIEAIVPGHGPRGNKATLELNRQYFSTLYNSVKELRDQDLEAYEMKPLIAEKLKDYQSWAGFSDELGKHISLSVLEAEDEDF